MVRNYKRKTTRGDWCKEAMKKAVEDVLAKKLGYRKAASSYGVPQTTLERYVNKVKQGREVMLGEPLRPVTCPTSNACADGDIGDTMKKDLMEISPEHHENEKNKSTLGELRKQLLSQRNRNSYKPHSRFRNVESEPEVTLYAETVETSDPLEALAIPGPSRHVYDKTVQDKEVYDTSESVQEIPPSKIARKNPFLRLSTSSLNLDIKEETTVQDSTRTQEETLADFRIISQDEVSEGDISSDIILSHFHPKPIESNSDSSVYFEARSIQKPKQKVTTEVLFHRYKLKSKREIDRLHNKIRELKATVVKYKRQVYRLQRQRDNVRSEK